jgi:hypothetical protein
MANLNFNLSPAWTKEKQAALDALTAEKKRHEDILHSNLDDLVQRLVGRYDIRSEEIVESLMKEPSKWQEIINMVNIHG